MGINGINKLKDIEKFKERKQEYLDSIKMGSED